MIDLRQLVRMRGMLLEVLAEPRVSKAPKGPYKGQHSPKYAEMADRYLAGEPVKLISNSGTMMYYALKKMGVTKRRRPRVIDTPREAEIVKAYLEGELWKRIGVSNRTLTTILRRAGIDPNRRPGRHASAALLLALLVSWPVWADCRPVTEILVEAELERGEVLDRALELPDGSVQALLVDPLERSWTLLRVTEGADVDQACVEARSEP